MDGYASSLSLELPPYVKAADERTGFSFNGDCAILSPDGDIVPHISDASCLKCHENEDLTMRLAKSIGLEVPLHGMIWAKDGTLTYFIKRFDRKGQKDKIPVEDFSQTLL